LCATNDNTWLAKASSGIARSFSRDRSVPTPHYSPTLTSQSVDDAQTFSAALAAQANSAPVVPAQSIGTPDPVTGVVTARLVAIDADENALTYMVTDAPTVGTRHGARPRASSH
jgi:hypothetical protein